MMGFFKKYFIPHKQNDHRPFFLRLESIVKFFLLALFAESLFLVQIFHIIPWNDFLANIMPESILDFTNQYRNESKLISLQKNSLLSEAARLKAEDMARNGYFSHTSPAGLTPWHWLDKVGYKYILAGENLAVNFVDSKDAVEAWMASASHRANIMNNNFTETGIGMAEGFYQGKKTIFVVQYFGRAAKNEKVVGVIAPTKAVSTKIEKQKREEIKKEIAKVEEKIPKVVSNQNTAPEELFIMVEGAAQEMAVSAPIVSVPEPPENLKQISLPKKWLSSPRLVSNYFYFTILTVILAALTLKIFIKIKIQYPVLILNGVFLFIFVAAVIWLNQYLVFSRFEIL